MLSYASKIQPFGDDVHVSIPSEVTTGPPAVTLPPIQDKVTWSWQVASPVPAATNIPLGPVVATADVPWIRIGQSSDNLVLTPNFAGLTAGVYQGTVTATRALPANVTGFTVQPLKIAVTLTVSDKSLLTSSVCCAFLAGGAGQPTSQALIPISSNGDPVAFTVTTSGASWLRLDADRGTTPAVLHPTADITGLAPGDYLSEISVRGPNNTLTFPRLSHRDLGPGA